MSSGKKRTRQTSEAALKHWYTPSLLEKPGSILQGPTEYIPFPSLEGNRHRHALSKFVLLSVPPCLHALSGRLYFGHGLGRFSELLKTVRPGFPPSFPRPSHSASSLRPGRWGSALSPDLGESLLSTTQEPSRHLPHINPGTASLPHMHDVPRAFPHPFKLIFSCASSESPLTLAACHPSPGVCF